MDLIGRGDQDGAMDPVLAELLERCRRDHLAWINGDGSPYELPDDGTILGAVGGFGRGGREAADRQRAVAAQWRSGTGTVEYLNGGVDGDIAWLALMERGMVELVDDAGGEGRRWDLRVTEVFRRTGAGWERLHRHADPLVDRQRLTDLVELLN